MKVIERLVGKHTHIHTHTNNTQHTILKKHKYKIKMQQQQQTFQGFQQGAMFQPFGAGNPMNMQGVQGYQAAPQMAFQQQQQQQQLSKCKITPAPYSRYLEFDCQKNITIQVCINTIKYCTKETFVGKLSPKVIYDRESVVIGKYGKRTTARFASGKCFGNLQSCSFKAPGESSFKTVEENGFFFTALNSINKFSPLKDECKKFIEASNLTVNNYNIYLFII